MVKKLENKLIGLSNLLVALLLVLVPFWAFISVWAASGVGHYTGIRLVIETLLMLLALVAAGILCVDKPLAKDLARQKWAWAIVAFFVLEVVWGVVAYYTNAVGAKALGYAWVTDSRYLLFFVAAYIVAKKNSFLTNNWKPLVLIPAALVAVFALLQFLILPINFLTHFGYNTHTIFPYETINHNKSYIRAMSFLRGANPLGAYMVVIASMSAVLLVKAKRKLLCGASLVLALLALIVSFSRSAWLGVVVSLVLLEFLLITKVKTKRIVLAGGLIVAAVLLLTAVGLKNNTSFQNYFLHTQVHSKIATNSNAGHLAALKNGISDFVRDPLGDGPGTSGPASVYNTKAPLRNTEDYYLMIGEEDGWLGLALLLLTFTLVAVELYSRKTMLAKALLASFAGLFVVNLLLPAWTDVTLAYIFWGLAAVALATKSVDRVRKSAQ